MQPEPHAEQASSDFHFSDHLEADLLERIREAAPIFKRNAALGEELRTPAPETVEVLDSLNIWGIMVPRRWSGLGMSASSMFAINRTIAKADMSTAWVVQILNGTCWIASLASDDVQEDVFGAGIPRICSGITPPGTATPVNGGYIVNGAWPYSSGSRQATWGLYGVSIPRPDGTVSMGNMAFIPIEDIELQDTWYATGLQGTGSDTGVVRDKFVPEHRVVKSDKPFDYKEPGRVHFGAPSDYWPVMTLIRSTAMGMMVGVAEAILEGVIQQSYTKPVVSTVYSRQMDSQVVQYEIGCAAAKIRAARLVCERATTALDRSALDRRMLSNDERVALRADTGLAAGLLVDAGKQLMYVAGSSAFMLKNDLQRYWRDLNVGARHLANLPNIGYELYGRNILDIEPNIAMPGAY